MDLLRGLAILLLIATTFYSHADIELPERRKDQFLTDSGYYIVPTPYSIPGLGDGLILVGDHRRERRHQGLWLICYRDTPG